MGGVGDMSIPRTLHEGGTGLGRDDTSEGLMATLYREALAENAKLRAQLSLWKSLAKFKRRLYFYSPLAYVAGFLSACGLIWLGVRI